MNRNKLLIIGGGTFAATVYKYFKHANENEIVGFAVHRQFKQEDTFEGVPIHCVEEISEIHPPGDVVVFVAISDHNLNRNRTDTYTMLKRKGYQFTSYIHDSAKPLIWKDVQIGENCIIMENVVIMDGANIGNNVVIGPGTVVSHLSFIKNNCFIAASSTLAGGVSVGENSYLGAGCVVGDDITIAGDNYIAMGAVINKNTKENTIYRGNPAKPEIGVTAKEFCRIKTKLKLEHKKNHVFF